jgi:hypothetical protein
MMKPDPASRRAAARALAAAVRDGAPEAAEEFLEAAAAACG